MNNRCHFFIGRQRMFPPVPFRSHQKRKLQEIECNRHSRVLANTIGTAHGLIVPGTPSPAFLQRPLEDKATE